MRVVLDTNVLVSATFWNGTSSKIIDLINKRELIGLTSNEILSEYKRTVESERIQNKTSNLTDSSLKIKSLLIIIDTTSKLNICTDSDDNKILECAVDGKSEVIITYDKHLLILKIFQKIPILTPEEFLEEFRKPSEK